uniref:Putative secreted protein n=1 Tax=Anopheles marajoara TaxID=58244 RepID=A0A2M4CC36_9DIPT
MACWVGECVLLVFRWSVDSYGVNLLPSRAVRFEHGFVEARNKRENTERKRKPQRGGNNNKMSQECSFSLPGLLWRLIK